MVGIALVAHVLVMVQLSVVMEIAQAMKHMKIAQRIAMSLLHVKKLVVTRAG